MDERSQFMQLLCQQSLQKADAVVLLAGDRYHRVAKAAELYHAGYAPRIVLTSNANDWDYGSLPSSRLIPKLRELGVPERDIIWEETASHTRAEADSTMRIAKERGWTTLILVTTRYHQYRAFLTWLKAVSDNDIEIKLFISAVQQFPDFYSETEYDAIEREFEKIKQYGERGHVARVQDGVAYLCRLKI